MAVLHAWPPPCRTPQQAASAHIYTTEELAQFSLISTRRPAHMPCNQLKFHNNSMHTVGEQHFPLALVTSSLTMCQQHLSMYSLLTVTNPGVLTPEPQQKFEKHAKVYAAACYLPLHGYIMPYILSSWTEQSPLGHVRQAVFLRSRIDQLAHPGLPLRHSESQAAPSHQQHRRLLPEAQPVLLPGPQTSALFPPNFALLIRVRILPSTRQHCLLLMGPPSYLVYLKRTCAINIYTCSFLVALQQYTHTALLYYS